ncbi:MAG TPA: hypothetical protein VF587_03095 [Solirubrobacteraceae bacterium]
MTERVSDLLTPSLDDHAAPPPGRRPWRLSSQFYVAFFGGVLAVTAIAFVNAGRLRADQRRRLLILGSGVLGLAAGIVAAVAGHDSLDASDLRLIERGIALVTCGAMYLIQRTPDRLHHYFGRGSTPDEEYDSLVGPGIAAVICGAIIQTAVFAAILL